MIPKTCIKLCLFLLVIWFAIISSIAFADDSLESDSFNSLEDELYSSDELYGDDEYMKKAERAVPDPLYWFNYAMFSFNDKLYFWFLKPVAQGYKFVIPARLRNGFKNCFHNALFPVRFANNILQGKGGRAVAELESFIINTVGGGLGFATPAQYVFGIKTYSEDLGQTFGHYYIKEGFYVVLPVIGPSTLRDSIGSVGDLFISPTTYIESAQLAAGVSALEQVNALSFRIGDYETLKSAAVDPYVALRDAYIQMRRKQVNQ